MLDSADFWLLDNDPALAGRTPDWLTNHRVRQGHAQGVTLDGAPELAAALDDDALAYEDAAAREARAEAAILMACSRPRDRQIIQRRLDGDSIPEIADSLGMTRQGAWAALRRIERQARAAVVAAMRDEGQEAAGHEDAPLPMMEGTDGQMGWAFQEAQP